MYTTRHPTREKGRRCRDLGTTTSSAEDGLRELNSNFRVRSSGHQHSAETEVDKVVIQKELEEDTQPVTGSKTYITLVLSGKKQGYLEYKIT